MAIFFTISQPGARGLKGLNRWLASLVLLICAPTSSAKTYLSWIRELRMLVSTCFILVDSLNIKKCWNINIKLLSTLLFFRLDSLEKHEALNLPNGYSLSLTYYCISSCCQSIFEAIESLRSRKEKKGCNEYKSNFVNLFKYVWEVCQFD